MAGKKIKASVAPIKIKTVKKLVELLKTSNTVMITSIKSLPSRQFQEIRKNLRGTADILVVKKRIMTRAIEKSGNKNVDGLKEHVQEDSAVLFSKEDAFEIAGILAGNKNPIGAKAGQEAIEDISVEEGSTDILPGPAISEFGSLGIQIAVEEGKIAIKEDKVIVKAGEKVSPAAASIMNKLEILPFKIGLEPIVICDIQKGKIYLDVKIDPEKAVEDLQEAAGKSLGLARKIVYVCKETIGYLLSKGNADAGALEKLNKASSEQSSKEEKPAEEKKEETKEEKQEEVKETKNTDEKKEDTQENKPKEEK